MMRRLAILLLLAVLASPASAHKLKVFATVEGDRIGGYAFFVGGGRPEGSSWVAKDRDGQLIAEGTTDKDGRFSFDLPKPPRSDITVTVDTHEAHIASATLHADRFITTPTGAVPAQSPGTTSPSRAAATLANSELSALVDIAVQKQIEPLMERIEQMNSRLRFVDIVSGTFLILGLAGILLWARGRRR